MLISTEIPTVRGARFASLFKHYINNNTQFLLP